LVTVILCVLCDQKGLNGQDGILDHPLLRSVPILVLANKQDAEDALGVAQVKFQFSESADRIADRDCKVQGISAATGYAYKDGAQHPLRRVCSIFLDVF
jgi:hypothetical protein